MTTVKNFGVIGAGQMGSGIAQVAAQSGLGVTLVDLKEEFLQRAKAGVEKSLNKLQDKGKISNAGEVLERLRFSTAIEDFKSCDFVVEAITENFDIKSQCFQSIDAVLPEHACMASNTSSISITKIAATTQRPTQVIGMHFMNPVPLMKLVEIIRGIQTSDETYALTKELSESMGKTTVLSKDSAGFLVNRVLAPMLNEAVWTLYSGIGSVEDIDTAMKLGTNQPMGPLTLADFIGLDTMLYILEVLHEEFGDKFKPCPLLKQYVDAGWLGRKSGRGFYDYSA